VFRTSAVFLPWNSQVIHSSTTLLWLTASTPARPPRSDPTLCRNAYFGLRTNGVQKGRCCPPVDWMPVSNRPAACDLRRERICGLRNKKYQLCCGQIARLSNAISYLPSHGSSNPTDLFPHRRIWVHGS